MSGLDATDPDVVTVPVSGLQRGLWFIDRLQPGRAAYNVITAFDLRGDVQWDLLQRSLDLLVARHDALRTSFGAENGEPVRIVQGSAHVPLRRSVLDPGEAADDRALRLAAAEGAVPFDLATAPLLRARAFTISPAHHILVLTAHHIVCDGWSQAVLCDDLGQLYTALAAGRPPVLPPLPVSAADLAARQVVTLADREPQLAYWRQTLSDLPDALELGAVRPRPVTATGTGGLLSWTIGPELTREFRRLCRAEKVSTFMAMTAVLQVFLMRHSGQTDLVVGAPVAVRPQPDMERLVGHFTNTLAIRTDLGGNPTFREALARVKVASLAAFEHQTLPFFEVVQAVRPDRSGAQSPVFQVMCAVQRVPDVLLSLGDVTVLPLALSNGTSKFDLLLDVQERRNEIAASFEYNADRFDEATCRQWIDRFARLIQAVCAGTEVAIGSLPILTADDAARLDEWNSTSTERDHAATIVGLFEQQVDRTPLAPAVSSGGDTLTFEALDARANQLAHALLSRGVCPGDRVGLCLERSLALPVAILGVLKVGAAYVPLDPAYPAERLRFMIEDAGVSTLLAPAAVGEAMLGTGDGRLFADWQDVSAACPSARPGLALQPSDACYVMYTSGSTGRPKGVVMPHAGLANLVEWQRARSAPALKTLQYSALSFDVSFQEFFTTWASGGALVLISETARRDPRELLDVLRTEAVERLFLPAVALQLLAETAVAHDAVPPSIREVITAGEQLRVTPSIRAFFTALPSARLDNQYGPTETHVVTAHLLTGAPAEWPELPSIGRPIANVQVHILDERLQPVPVGTKGEVWLSGIALATGYFRREDLTRDRFRAVQVGKGLVRAYRTGDAARHRPDGTIEFLGRCDDQVKIRGFRVEPGEVEAVLEGCPSVRRATVVARPHATGTRLVAYYVPAPGAAATSVAVRDWLATRVPDHMVPSHFTALTDLPLTPSGKIDRRKLPADTGLLEVHGASGIAPADAVEEQLVTIWREVLGLASVGTHDRFFDVGGHSLAAARVFAQIETQMQVRLPLAALFDSPTIAGLAALIRDRRAASDLPRDTPPVFRSLVTLQRGLGRTPLIFVHGGGGHVLNARDLAGAMHPSQPVYGLQAAGVDGVVRPHESIEAMAEAYLAEVRALQPHGPYLLAGYSGGGVVAFEMARRLSEQGEPIGMLALIDTFHPHVKVGQASLRQRWGRLMREGLPYLRGAVARMLGRLRTARDIRLIEAHLAAGEPIPLSLSELHLMRSFERASRQYQPMPWPGRATLFRAEQSHRLLHDGGPTHGWDRVVSGGVTVVVVPGDHETLLHGQNVERIASSMHELIDAVAPGADVPPVTTG